jgi:hypothetical protein
MRNPALPLRSQAELPVAATPARERLPIALACEAKGEVAAMLSFRDTGKFVLERATGTGAGFIKSRRGWRGGLLWGLPKSAFPRVHRRRMPWVHVGAASIAKVRFFGIIAAVRAQGRLRQLSAINRHNQQVG